MNATIIEYVNGMEVVKVFGRDGESYQRYEKDIKDYCDFTLVYSTEELYVSLVAKQAAELVR